MAAARRRTPRQYSPAAGRYGRSTGMVQARPFRFGVLVERFGTRKELVGTARKAEEAGYATFLVRDHVIAEPFGHQSAPLTRLATVAAVTERLRVGTLVFDNDYRHPA